MTTSELLEIAESLEKDKTKLMMCLNGLMAIAMIGRQQDQIKLISDCLKSLENKTLNRPQIIS